MERDNGGKEWNKKTICRLVTSEELKNRRRIRKRKEWVGRGKLERQEKSWAKQKINTKMWLQNKEKQKYYAGNEEIGGGIEKVVKQDKKK